jgi:type II secretion system protein C
VWQNSMVKKFFRKIFKKKVPPKNSGDVDLSSKNQNESDPIFDQEISSEEIDILDHKIILNPEDTGRDENIEDLEDLPDLPKEVLSAIKESQELDTVDSEIDPDSEIDDFDFTEIKAQEIPPLYRKDSETEFEYDELQVSLPSDTKKNKLKKILNKVIGQIESFLRERKSPNGTPGMITSSRKSQFHQLFIIILVSSSCYYSGKIISYLLGGNNPGKQSQKSEKYLSGSSSNPSIAKLERLNPLDALASAKKTDKKEKEKPKKVVIDEKKICETSSKKSSLKINIGTVIVLQDRVKSIASVQTRKKEKYIREGDKLDGMAIIGSINLDKIVFRNLENGVCEYVQTPIKKESSSSKSSFSKVKIHPAEKAKEFINKETNIKVEGNNYKIDKKIRNELLDNITDVLSQARAIQIKNSDGSLSFKIVEITPGSIYSKLNIQENDVITKINGDKIDNLNEIMSLFGRIKDLKTLDLGIERDGIENDFQYSFE